MATNHRPSRGNSSCSDWPVKLQPRVPDSWAQISAMIRRIDAERVGNCKEDIDNILIFAGLYSAVLTAFLVESYRNLQQDPQNAIVILLQQLILQTNSFVINDGFISSANAQRGTIPTFSPSVNAQRVNVLWFSSIVLSLGCGSFGIIVKQWLREFSTGEQASPLVHLRIRLFRDAGLRRYKVFDIAAALPLLLQLSLALFFVGLCFFTADVHDSIGHTTLPLVAGWAFLFIAVTFTPLFDPTCPYKSPMLKNLFARIHSNINTPFGSLCRTSKKLLSRIRAIFKGPTRDRERMRDFSDGDRFVLGNDEELVTDLESEGVVAHQETEEAVADREVEEEVADREIEEVVADQEIEDVRILIEAVGIDAIQANPRVLEDMRNIMATALHQSYVQPGELVQLPLTLINRKLRPGAAGKLSQSFLDLRRMPLQEYSIIMDMFAQLARSGVDRHHLNIRRTSSSAGPDNSCYPGWLESCICALLSPSDHHDHPSLQGVDETLAHCLNKGHNYAMLSIIRSRLSGRNSISELGRVLWRLVGVLRQVKDTETLLTFVSSLVNETQPREGSSVGLIRHGEHRELPSQVLDTTAFEVRPALRVVFQHHIQSQSSRAYTLDQDTLLRIDKLILDDTIVRDMWDMISAASNANRERMAKFLAAIMHNRAGTGLNPRDVVQAHTSFLDLSNVELDTYNMITKLCALLVPSEELHRVKPGYTDVETVKSFYDVLEFTLCVLLSRSKVDKPEGFGTPQEPDGIDSALRDCICLPDQEQRLKSVEIIRKRIKHCSWTTNDSTKFELSRILKRLGGGLVLVDTMEHLLTFFQQLFCEPLLDKENITITLRYTKILSRSDDIHLLVPRSCRDDVLNLVVRVATEISTVSNGTALPAARDNEATDDETHLVKWTVTDRLMFFDAILQLSGDVHSKSQRMKKIAQLGKQLLLSSHEDRGLDAGNIHDLTFDAATRPVMLWENRQKCFAVATISYSVDGLIECRATSGALGILTLRVETADLRKLLCRLGTYWKHLSALPIFPDEVKLTATSIANSTQTIVNPGIPMTQLLLTCRLCLQLLKFHWARYTRCETEWKSLFGYISLSLDTLRNCDDRCYGSNRESLVIQQCIQFTRDVRALFGLKSFRKPSVVIQYMEGELQQFHLSRVARSASEHSMPQVEEELVTSRAMVHCASNRPISTLRADHSGLVVSGHSGAPSLSLGLGALGTPKIGSYSLVFNR